jgi:glycosyltransferase involved in cell wall biosynthesis
MVIRVCVFHQTDPAGAVTGGIDSVIRGIAKWAPSDIEYSIVGLTMDERARPVGQWHRLDVGGREVKYFPVGRHTLPMQRALLPLSVRLAIGIARFRRSFVGMADIFEVHRIEPAVVLAGLGVPMNAFMHQNMDVLYDARSDIGWKRAPGLYFALERHILPHINSVFGVRANAVAAYRERYPEIADRFHFIPTWFEPDVFQPAVGADLQAARKALRDEYGFAADAEILVFVGRLDQQKNPLLLIESFKRLLSERPTVRLVMVGDGILRAELERAIHEARLDGLVALAGLKSPDTVAKILRGADLYVMTSAYEGMPIGVLEALGTGLPVVSTRVGELGRVVTAGENGELIDRHEPANIAAGCLRTLQADRQAQRRASLAAVSAFVPAKVLTPVFDAYRAAAAQSHQLR